MKIKILVFCLIAFCITINFLNVLLAEDISKSDYERRDKLILQHIKIGEAKINNFKLTGEVLKKILYGYWRVDEYETVEFYKNGIFKVMDWEDSDKGDMLYKGKWRTEDNTIIFMVDGSGTWQKCSITKIILQKSNKKFVKYDYSLTFFLEKVKFKSIYRGGIFLDGGIFTEVDEPKAPKKNEKKSGNTMKKGPKKKK